MISAFQFLSYRIHYLRMTAQGTFSTYQGQIVDPNDVWRISLNVREPIFYKKTKAYLGGVDLALNLFGKDLPEEDRSPEKATLTVEAGISGVFNVEKGRLSKETEDQLVKVQIPAILFPYLRGAVTSLLANAGFGSVILPLINMNEVGKSSLQDKAIVEVDE